MFARIAPRYDRINRILSAGRDRRWRSLAVARAIRGIPAGPVRVLDTCAGTGDLAVAFRQALGERGRVTACDFTQEMILRLRRKSRRVGVVVGDSRALPFRSARFDIVAAAFGIRNVALGSPSGLGDALREMGRVLVPGGRLIILEFSRGQGHLLGRLARLWWLHIVPCIGNGASRGREKAYHYLSRSVDRFPDGEAFLDHLRKAGFAPQEARSLAGGLVTLYTARSTP
jgi:demethylmenaquinone methyltransferase/2-methoxy-6-polyprenyl-1,4-benzoquinol methylase